jgi:hypothetical protein
LVVGRKVLSQRDEPAPVVVPREVEHDRSQVRRCLRGITNLVCASGEPDECFLHEIFGRVAVVDKEAREAYKR